MVKKNLYSDRNTIQVKIFNFLSSDDCYFLSKYNNLIRVNKVFKEWI